jgi:hypothetical protein
MKQVSMLERKEEFQRQNKYRLIARLIIAIDLVLIIFLVICYVLVRGNVLSLLNTIAFGLFPFIGAVIITRQPRNPVPWIGIAVGLIFVLNDLLGQYSTYALLIHPNTLPFGGFAAWVTAWLWALIIFLAVPFILLIPNGHLPSPRWRWIILASIILTAPSILGIMVASWLERGPQLFTAENDSTVLNPLGYTIGHLLFSLLYLLIFLVFIAAAGMLIRFIHSRGIERMQLKWIALACMLIPISIAVGSIIGNTTNPLPYYLNQLINLASAYAVPIAFAFAMTRYRLYEIDVIIRRTLVYSILTLVLALVYFGSVFILQEGFTLITGQQSAISIVISTLLIAAIFTPLRRRIQGGIDRRFYRRKYQADQMLAQFAATQRDTVEMEQINQHLIRIVEEALQPQFVSLAFVKKSSGSLEGKGG